MCFEKLSPFTHAILGGLLGIIIGIIGGLLFSTVIVWLISILHTGSSIVKSDVDAAAGIIPPYAIAQFLGAGAGAIIGSIIGAIYSNKK